MTSEISDEPNSPIELDAVFYAMERSDCRSFVPRLRGTIVAAESARSEAAAVIELLRRKIDEGREETLDEWFRCVVSWSPSFDKEDIAALGRALAAYDRALSPERNE